MTDNLPTPVGFRTGVADVPLSQTPTAALAFALGYAVARPQSADAFGPFCAMVEELMRRPAVTADGWEGYQDGPEGVERGNAFGQLMGLLPEPQARAIVMLYQAQRGQRWARTGQYRHGRETGGRRDPVG